MIKLFVTDLDGTLLLRGRRITEEDKKAIYKLTENKDQIQLCVASGRMDIEIQKVLEEIGQTAYRISQNGAFVYGPDNEKKFSHAFTYEVATELYAFLPKRDDMLITVFTEDTGFIKEEVPNMDKLEDELFFPLVVEPNIENVLKTKDVSKISVSGETEKLKELEEKVRDAFPNDVETFISDANMLDIMPKHISKGEALKELMNELHISPEEMVCIGDAYNDISMFRLTPNSYSLSHSEQEVKKHANFVVDSVHDMIEHLLRKE